MSDVIRGVICAGGVATRLGELTRITNKHLLPVGPWPMIFYPLMTLQKAGIREVLIVTGKDHCGDFIDHLGDGQVCCRDNNDLLFDLELTYKVQTKAGGIAQAVALAKNFASGGKIVVILGDNIIEDDIAPAVERFKDQGSGARIFLKKVSDPRRFGIPWIEGDKIVKIVEKPKKEEYPELPNSYAVTGLYMFDSQIFNIIRTLKPSGRNELEITDVNNIYVRKRQMKYEIFNGFWKDAGTHKSLSDIGNLILKTGAFEISV